MKLSGRPTGILLAVTAVIAINICLTGCQTTVGGQTLPSPDYLIDDVQYFPAGPENQLTNTIEAQKQYRDQQNEIRDGF